MKEIISKITSYNIFNYLFPGVVFVLMLEYVSNYNLIIDDFLIGVFFYYFIGLLISRIGSLVIEPIFKRISIVKFADYSSFIQASKEDDKISLFSEINNMYRTVISLVFMLLVFKGYEILEQRINIPTNLTQIFVLLLLILIFILSYRKQTEYITKRIDNQRKN